MEDQATSHSDEAPPDLFIDGEMGRLVREYDWSTTPLGPSAGTVFYQAV